MLAGGAAFIGTHCSVRCTVPLGFVRKPSIHGEDPTGFHKASRLLIDQIVSYNSQARANLTEILIN